MNIKENFIVEGVDWTEEICFSSDYENVGKMLVGVATIAVKRRIDSGEMKLGAIVLVRGKTLPCEFMINSYHCLIGSGHNELAHRLRVEYKKVRGQDLSKDEVGYHKSKKQ